MSRTPHPIPASASSDAEVPIAVLVGANRVQVRRLHVGILLFFLIDGLLLSGYGWAGTVSLQAGWRYALGGCCGSAALILPFWLRGGRIADLDPVSLGLTVFTVAVMLLTLGLVPAVGGLVMMSMMALISLSAVQLGLGPLLLLCLLLAAGSLSVLTLVGETARIPGANAAERWLTGAWFTWLLLKASSHNAVARQLRGRADLATAKLAKALAELEVLASTDELTRLSNRRSIIDRLKEALEQAPDAERRVGVAVFDIDHFKAVNDRHGHEIGDQVLRLFAELAARSLRPSDRLGRYGGEEFLLVLQELPDARSVQEATERVRSRIEAHDWTSVAPGLAVTVSAGVALVGPDETSSAAIQRADAALYDAKRGGRNRVVVREAVTRLE